VLIHYLQAPCADYVRGAVEAALEIHRVEGPGDVLVFLTGEDEIESAVRLLQDEAADAAKRLLGSGGAGNGNGGPERMTVHPLYAGLSPAQQLEAGNMHSFPQSRFFRFVPSSLFRWHLSPVCPCNHWQSSQLLTSKTLTLS
jgi:HrpA-like RNA helicase